MTKEEIKAAFSMKDIAGRNGLYPNRAGFVSCPFHKGDREASMKVYDKDFHCFGCGANGDIFEFVRRMEGIGFREAFLLLGGTYEKPTFSSKLAVYRSQKRVEMRRKKEWRIGQERELNARKIHIFREAVKNSEPLSDVWCDCYNALQIELYRHAEINGLESRW